MFVIGDIHGYTLDWKTGKRGFDYIMGMIENTLQGANIIQVGDFGMTNDVNRMNKILKKFNKILKRVDSKMYVIRGNHDNPAFWNGTHIYSNIELVPDYETRVIDGKTVLFMGGAISIDRVERIKTYNLYWVDEVFVLNRELLNTIKGVDIVVTHTAPKFAFPQTGKGILDEYVRKDHTLLQECARERLDMTEAYNILKENNNITNWLYGHFHTNEVTPHEGCEFRVVGINDTYHLRTEVEYGY